MMIETCRSIFKSFNINNLSVCIGWCADRVIVEGVYKLFLRNKRNSALDAQGLSIQHITVTQVVQNEKFPKLPHTIVFNALNSQETVV